MKKSPVPNQSYFKPVLFTDPTYGHTNPVFLLCTDSKNVYFTSIPVFIALKKSNSLDKLPNRTFLSPYQPNSPILLEEDVRQTAFFCDSIDLNWFYYEDCLYTFTEDVLTITKKGKSFHPSHPAHYDYPDSLLDSSIGEHISLIHIFCSYFFLDKPNYYTRHVSFVSEFANHHLDFFNFFPKTALYYLDLFATHFAKSDELEHLLFETMFSTDRKQQRVFRALRDYYNQKNG